MTFSFSDKPDSGGDARHDASQPATQPSSDPRPDRVHPARGKNEQFPHPECSLIHERRSRRMRSGYDKKLKEQLEQYESLQTEKQEVDAEIASLRADLCRNERQLELAAARKKTVSDERILQAVDVISQHVNNTMSRKKRKKILHALADPQVLIEKKLMAAMAKKFGLTGKAAKNTNKDIYSRIIPRNNLSYCFQKIMTTEYFIQNGKKCL